jgi:acetate kinase
VQVLIVNAGSTSLKLSLVGPDDVSTPVEALETVPPGIAAVGHRVVHGGSRFRDPVLVDDGVLEELDSLTALAPLHNAPALAAVREARAALPGVPHVAVFDTAFHSTLPEEAYTYPLPLRFRDELGIRRFGFHGLSVQWASEQVKVPRLVVCHLGGGCSVTAVLGGESVDTTMGFTPLDGVPMSTRPGSLDPGVLFHLLRSGGLSLDELDRVLEHESGLLGVSGISGDMRELEESDDDRAQLAISIFTRRMAAAVAASATALGGLDALVFTGGVGEHSAGVRAEVCRLLEVLGVELDHDANAAAEGGDAEIASQGSHTRVVVVRSREDVVIARAARLFA